MNSYRSLYSLNGFILTFPGLLISFILSERLFWDGIFNAYFISVSFAVSVTGLAFLVADSGKKMPQPLPTIVLLLLLIVAALGVSSYAFFTEQRVGKLSLLGNALSGCAQILGAFFIVYYWDFNSRIHQITAIAGMIVSGVLVLLLTKEGLVTDGATLAATSTGVTSVAYQMIARVMVFCGLLAAVSTRNILVSGAIALLAVAALFQNGARTEFLLFFLATSVMIFMLLFRKGPAFYGAFIALTAGILVLATNADAILAMLPQSRILEVIRLEDSSSWNARAIAYDYAKDTIANYPLTGDYGSDFDRFGPGFYAHNIVSSWVDLGLFGFVVAALLLLRPLLFSLRWAFRAAHLPAVRLCVGTAIYSALGYAFSYYYLTAYLGLSVAAFVRAWRDVMATRRKVKPTPRSRIAIASRQR